MDQLVCWSVSRKRNGERWQEKRREEKRGGEAGKKRMGDRREESERTAKVSAAMQYSEVHITS